MSFNRCSTYRKFSILATIILVCLVIVTRLTTAKAGDFVLVRDGQPAATIVIAAAPTDVAAFSAQELQYHVQKITGATLPIKSDAEKVEGAKNSGRPQPQPPNGRGPKPIQGPRIFDPLRR